MGLIARILSSDFAKNIFSLVGGSIIAQLIAIGSSPVITRLFNPENFGILALFTSSVMVVSSISSMCYERAILLPREEEDAVNLVWLSALVLLLTTAAALAMVVLVTNFAADVLVESHFEKWIWLLPVAALLAGAGKVVRFWRLRNKAFKSLAWSRIGEALVASLIKMIVGFFIGAYTSGLICAFLVGGLVSLTILLARPKWIEVRQQLTQISKIRMKENAARYKKFPCFASWNTLLNMFSQNIVIFLFSLYFSPTVVGLLSLGNRVLQQPIVLLSESVQNAYFQKASRDYMESRSLYSGLVKTILILSGIGVIPFAVLAFFSRFFFGVIFGANWETAGLYIQIMAPWFFLLFIGSPANVIYEVCQKQELKLFLNLTQALCRCLAIIVGYFRFNNPIYVLILLMAVNTIFEIVIITLSILITKKMKKIAIIAT